MALNHYWTGSELTGAEYTQIPGPSLEITYQTLATRDPSDSHLRSIWYPRAGAQIASASGIPENWWVAAHVYVFWTFDSTGSVVPGDPFGDDPEILGICSLEPVISYAPTANHYAIDWVGPRDGVRLQTARKGFSTSTVPGILTTFVFADNDAVFSNPSNLTNRLFSANLIGRVLWGSVIPRTP